MDFNRHSDLIGKHAILSASQYHWIRYTPEKMADRYANMRAAALGTEMHELASQLIKLGVKLPNTGQTINMYVNDCIGYRMKPEQIVFYSYKAFGTTDAIDFSNRILRIFDLKNGVNKASGDQLKTYAAFFCLEYKIKPFDIEEFDLRIYQNDEIVEVEVEPEEILYIMDKIVEFDKLLTMWESEDN